MGDAKKKIQAIEDTDRLVVGTLLEGLKKRGEPYAIMVVPDHPTSVAIKTHIADPVPFAIYATHGPKDHATAYNESVVKQPTQRFTDGYQLMSYFLGIGKQES